MLLRVCSFRRRIFPRFLFTKQDEIFVSKYSRVDPKEMDSLLHIMEGEGNKVRSTANGKFEVMECRLCDKGNKSNADNLWKLLINPDGSFHCYRCSTHGSWFKLRQLAKGLNSPSHYFRSANFSENSSSETRGNITNTIESKRFSPILQLPDQREAFSYYYNLFPSKENTEDITDPLEKTLLSSQSAADARKYLTEKRGLTLDVCQQYGLGLCIQEFPEDVEKDGKKEKLKEAAQLLESYRDDDRKAKVEATKKVTAEKKKKKEIEEAKEKEKAIKAAAKSAKMEQKSKEKMAKKAAREKKKLLAEKENVVSAEGEVKKRGRPNKASLAPKSETTSVGFRGTVGSYDKVGIKDENDVQGFINSEPPLEAVDEAVGAEEPTTEEKEAPKETFVAKKEDNSGSLGVTKRVEIEEKRNAYKRVPGPRWVKEVCLTFPWITPIKTLSGDELKAFTKLAVVKKKPAAVQAIVRIKVRALSGKGKQRLLPKGGGWGFFGWHLVNEEDTSIIITEGEFDAMAVFQTLRKLPASHPFGSVPVVSLPNGCNSFPPELIAKLERFETIYLWMDNDTSGQLAATKFVKKLGHGRCLLVKPLLSPSPSTFVPKDANEALLHNIDMIPMLENAKRMEDDRIQTYKDLKDLVLQLSDVNEEKGIGALSLPKFNDIIKGFREGELVPLSGPTGSGKTTFLSQLSIDFAKQGKSVLWGSFEINNVVLLQKKLTQFSKIENVRSIEKSSLELISNDFEALPLYYMKYFGSTDIDEVLDTMYFAEYSYDTKVVILDNLQFMMPMSRSSGRPINSNFDKFEQQDAVIAKLRQFATEKGVLVFLVIHPRKEDENTMLSLSSIYGSGKATQEADTVLIIQKVDGETFIDVKKNRHDGSLGKVKLKFDQPTKLFHEVAGSNVNKYKPNSTSASTNYSKT